MGSLMREMSEKALRLGIPLGVQLDLTYRCNERCVHCYLDHDDRGEMTTAEVTGLLDQMADAGVFFLVISGGEIFLRPDLFDVLAHARRRTFSVKLKTNGVLVSKSAAERIAALNVDSVQVSIYSHKAEVHDAITRLPGSLTRTLEGAALLMAEGVRVSVANVLMRQNAGDYAGVRELARRLGMRCTVDPTVTPMMDGGRSVLGLNVDHGTLAAVFHDSDLVGRVEEFCAPPGEGPPAEKDALELLPCSAGHTACYVSPYGDVYPCVQFPLPSGNVRTARFADIWRDSPQLKEVRSITMHDLQGCSTCAHGSNCSRCPGLAYLEGNMRGPSVQDCEKSFARTGVEPRHLVRTRAAFPEASPAAGGAPGSARC